MLLKIKFKFDKCGYCIDPLMDKIRDSARTDGYALTEGFKEWAFNAYTANLKTYDAKYNSNGNDNPRYKQWKEIIFKTEQDFTRFKQDFGVE